MTLENKKKFFDEVIKLIKKYCDLPVSTEVLFDKDDFVKVETSLISDDSNISYLYTYHNDVKVNDKFSVVFPDFGGLVECIVLDIINDKPMLIKLQIKGHENNYKMGYYKFMKLPKKRILKN